MEPSHVFGDGLRMSNLDPPGLEAPAVATEPNRSFASPVMSTFAIIIPNVTTTDVSFTRLLYSF